MLTPKQHLTRQTLCTALSAGNPGFPRQTNRISSIAFSPFLPLFPTHSCSCRLFQGNIKYEEGCGDITLLLASCLGLQRRCIYSQDLVRPYDRDNARVGCRLEDGGDGAGAYIQRIECAICVEGDDVIVEPGS